MQAQLLDDAAADDDPETAARRHFERENERLADYRFPSWWFAVLAAPNVLPALFGTPFQSIVWPLAIADLAGYSNKQLLFAATGQVAMVMSWSAPFVGSWSDRVPLALARRFGRRRPFIVAGRFCSVAGNLLIYIGAPSTRPAAPRGRRPMATCPGPYGRISRSSRSRCLQCHSVPFAARFLRGGLTVCGLLGTAMERLRSAPLLFAGLVLMNLGGCIASPAFAAVVLG
jgi:hypothetical protein